METKIVADALSFLRGIGFGLFIVSILIGGCIYLLLILASTKYALKRIKVKNFWKYLKEFDFYKVFFGFIDSHPTLLIIILILGTIICYPFLLLFKFFCNLVSEIKKVLNSEKLLPFLLIVLGCLICSLFAHKYFPGYHNWLILVVVGLIFLFYEKISNGINLGVRLLLSIFKQKIV